MLAESLCHNAAGMQGRRHSLRNPMRGSPALHVSGWLLQEDALLCSAQSSRGRLQELHQSVSLYGQGGSGSAAEAPPPPQARSLLVQDQRVCCSAAAVPCRAQLQEQYEFADFAAKAALAALSKPLSWSSRSVH